MLLAEDNFCCCTNTCIDPGHLWLDLEHAMSGMGELDDAHFKESIGGGGP